jgi:hypothetical protein
VVNVSFVGWCIAYRLIVIKNLLNRMSQKNIYYSEKYYDNEYEYRYGVFCVISCQIP